MESLSRKDAGHIIFSSQKLGGSALSPLEIIEHLGYVQIDTISVVERAHHHVFWARNQDYRPQALADLVKKRKVFEYWSHAASFLPMKDYRYTLPMKEAFRKKESNWFPRDPKLMSEVLKRIRQDGPLQSKDFENNKKKGTGWWDWKPAKKALERLFMEGHLEISRREGFQKVYDLPERVIPDWVDTSMPSEKESTRFLIHRTLRHHGLANAAEVAYLCRNNVKVRVEKELKSMLADGELQQVKIEGLSEPYFASPKTLKNQTKLDSKVSILSPFDNLIIQRKKLKTFFDFDYQIECYVPEKKRKHGYFCLPVFRGSQAIGRIDCKADRKNKTLILNSMHLENGRKLPSGFKAELKRFAEFNDCEAVIARSNPDKGLR